MKFQKINRQTFLRWLWVLVFPLLLLLQTIFPGLAELRLPWTSGEQYVLYESGTPDRDHLLTIRYIDVGQGDAILIEDPGGECMLIDAGTNASEMSLLSSLAACSIRRLTYMVFTHPHEDHIGGGDRVLARHHADTVLIPECETQTSSYDKLMEAAERYADDVLYVSPGDTYGLGDAVFTILAPLGGPYENGNNDSIVLRLTYGDRSFLFTGDAEAFSEEEMLAAYPAEELRSDVLKLGHHGSSTSSTEVFLDAVKPIIAVASCGLANEYGHPHAETVKRLNDREILLFRTDACGTILIETDGEALRVTSDKKQ